MTDATTPSGALHPQAQAHLDRLAQAGAGALHTVTPERARRGWRARIPLLGEPEPVARTEDRPITTPAGTIPVRVYTPAGAGPFPVLVYFHGGGFALGDLDTHDGLCRGLANGAGCAVVAVDYPLAPENPFPAAVEACHAATAWVRDHAAELDVDPARVAVGGDSAGGNLAAVVTHLARERGGPALAFQLLIYPDVDFRRTNTSIRAFAGRYGNISREGQRWFMDNYVPTERDRLDPRVSPLLAPDLAGLPPALVITAEFDALRDEGEEYGRRLAEAGVPVTITRYPGMIHEFVRYPFDDSALARREAAAALRNSFAP